MQQQQEKFSNENSNKFQLSLNWLRIHGTESKEKKFSF